MKRLMLLCVLAGAAWAQDAQVRGKQLIEQLDHVALARLQITMVE